MLHYSVLETMLYLMNEKRKKKMKIGKICKSTDSTGESGTGMVESVTDRLDFLSFFLPKTTSFWPGT